MKKMRKIRKLPKHLKVVGWVRVTRESIYTEYDPAIGYKGRSRMLYVVERKS